MRHWLRKLPKMDDHFVYVYLTKIEALHEERKRLTQSINEAEAVAVAAASERWSPVKVSECHAKYMNT